MNNSFKIVKNIWDVLPSRKKRSLKFFLIILAISGLLELSTLTIIYPFLYLITNNTIDTNLPLINLYINSIAYEEALNLLSILLLFFIAISALFRLIVSYKLNMQVADITSFLSSTSFRKTIKQPYKYHILENSNKTISISTHQVNDLFQGIMNVFNFISYVITSLFIILAIIIISPRISLSALFLLSVFFLMISFFMKNRLIRISNTIVASSESQVKLMQESLGAIKDIIVNNLADKYSSLYSKKDLLIRQKTALAYFYGSFPRYITESFILIVVISIIYISFITSGVDTKLFALLGTFALAIQKLLPALQISYAAWSGFNAKTKSFKNILERINLPLESESKSKIIRKDELKFNDEIEFKGVSYRYKKDLPFIIDNINIQIKKSSKIGIIGETGSGKSTFVDLLLGLISPTKGEVLIDGKNIDYQNNGRLWLKNISYVSQDIYLSDSTFLSNITASFDEDDENIDLGLVIDAAKKAYIHDFINSLPNKYNTSIGERGAQLSGGQIQRIAIARALYKKSEIIILDEATSALDLKTEKLIMDSIYSNFRNSTLIIIAHRMSTLKKCDIIYEVDNKNLNQYKI